MNRTTLVAAGALGLALLCPAPAAKAAEVETVRLRDGKTYEVPTGNGMPLPFKSRQIEVKALGPIFGTEGRLEWALHAELRASGRFTVTASTPLDPTLSFKFDCKGPGEVTQLMFRDNTAPAVWQWYGEPGTSWVPFVFRFANKESGETFQVTQWTKFDPVVKVRVKQQLRELKQKQ
jgi:hypothetical protein